jgi:putative membrane protein
MAGSADESDAKGADRTELAENRTEWAEDRTLMANERTFAGWMRTGLASVGIGLGFNALFGKLEPAWVPRAIATIFICMGVVIFWTAQAHSCAVNERLSAHQAEPVKGMKIRIVAAMFSLGGIALVAAIWMLDLSAR